jgi:hypothetical protein
MGNTGSNCEPLEIYNHTVSMAAANKILHRFAVDELSLVVQMTP